jgi:hypothetical protein
VDDEHAFLTGGIGRLERLPQPSPGFAGDHAMEVDASTDLDVPGPEPREVLRVGAFGETQVGLAVVLDFEVNRPLRSAGLSPG